MVKVWPNLPQEVSCYAYRKRPFNSMENSAQRLRAILLTIIWIGMEVNGDDLAGDSRALVAFRKGVGGRMKAWNGDGSACDWEGITCNSKSRVVSVSLPAAELSGIIPPGTLRNLTELRKLRLRFNALRGSIPTDLSNCKELRTLYLQGNRFSGPLPADFSVWHHLSRLNLALNNFSGPLPTSLNTLKRLGTLFLENNSFTGPLPPLDLPNLVYFNVSNNNLTGAVPNSYKKFFSDSFRGNNNLCYPCDNKSKTYRRDMIIGIVMGGLLLVCLIIGVILLVSRRHRIAGNDKIRIVKKPAAGEKQRAEEIDSSFTKDEYSISVQEPEKINNRLVVFPSSDRPFSLEDLLRASAERMGRGSVYKAVLETGSVVVVKRMTDVVIGPTDFAHLINMVAKMKHPNLVALKAYYYSKDEKLLVYGYMPLGSLASLLHGKRGAGRTPLNWDTRVHIALGAAMGIEYLHKQGSKISHGNIKSTNILITEKYDACVSDFGLAQMVMSGKGNVGYKAPEVSDGGKVCQEADVYSFGVLLLEVVTGKAPLCDEGVDLPRWVQSVVREEWTAEVFDMELMRIQPWQCHSNEEEMLQFLQVGMACVAHYPDQRPTMSQVVKMIQHISHTDDQRFKAKDFDHSEKGKDFISVHRRT